MNFPKYSEEHLAKIMRTLDPVGEYGGYSIKRGDLFSLDLVKGSKVRQCLWVVHKHLEGVRNFHNSTIITGHGLPSPQGAIVSAVGKYFGLNTICVCPKYKDSLRDFKRINVSLAQKYGAKIYGVGNPNPTGYQKDVKVLIEETHAFEIKFGMIGDVAMQPIIYQVQNIPEYVTEITVISGSGLSALSILRGLVKYQKKVEQVNIITLSSFFERNKERWYDPLPEKEKFQGVLNVVKSKYPYQRDFKYNKSFDFDLTYESKAFAWLVENRKPSKEQLFWVVGIRDYDLENIEQINWFTSSYEEKLNIMRKERQLARDGKLGEKIPF